MMQLKNFWFKQTRKGRKIFTWFFKTKTLNWKKNHQKSLIRIFFFFKRLHVVEFVKITKN